MGCDGCRFRAKNGCRILREVIPVCSFYKGEVVEVSTEKLRKLGRVNWEILKMHNNGCGLMRIRKTIPCSAEDVDAAISLAKKLRLETYGGVPFEMRAESLEPWETEGLTSGEVEILEFYNQGNTQRHTQRHFNIGNKTLMGILDKAKSLGFGVRENYLKTS